MKAVLFAFVATAIATEVPKTEVPMSPPVTVDAPVTADAPVAVDPPVTLLPGVPTPNVTATMVPAPLTPQQQEDMIIALINNATTVEGRRAAIQYMNQNNIPFVASRQCRASCTVAAVGNAARFCPPCVNTLARADVFQPIYVCDNTADANCLNQAICDAGAVPECNGGLCPTVKCGSSSKKGLLGLLGLLGIIPIVLALSCSSYLLMKRNKKVAVPVVENFSVYDPYANGCAGMPTADLCGFPQQGTLYNGATCAAPVYV